jgi:hypothetical protein
MTAPDTPRHVQNSRYDIILFSENIFHLVKIELRVEG